MEAPPTPRFARPAVNMIERQHFNWTQNSCESRPPLISTQKALQRDVNLRGQRDMKAEQMRPPAPRSVTSEKHPGKVGSFLLWFQRVRGGSWASSDLCDPLRAAGQPVSQSAVVFQEASRASRLVMREDGLLNQLPPWDSLCSQR